MYSHASHPILERGDRFTPGSNRTLQEADRRAPCCEPEYRQCAYPIDLWEVGDQFTQCCHALCYRTSPGV